MSQLIYLLNCTLNELKEHLKMCVFSVTQNVLLKNNLRNFVVKILIFKTNPKLEDHIYCEFLQPGANHQCWVILSTNGLTETGTTNKTISTDRSERSNIIIMQNFMWCFKLYLELKQFDWKILVKCLKELCNIFVKIVWNYQVFINNYQGIFSTNVWNIESGTYLFICIYE